jgi:hypothetical protein
VEEESAVKPTSDQAAAGAETDWLALGDGPNDWLFPSVDHNPRSPATRVAIRHRPGQSVVLKVDGKPVDPVAFEGALTAAAKTHSVSVWRGIPLEDETSRFVAEIREADGSLAQTLEREVYFSARPARAEFIPEKSQLVADGRSRPVLAVRITDRHGRPVHAGLTGQMTLNSPYESARAIEASQSRALGGLGSVSPTWHVEGDDGIAYIELAPTMVSGSLRAEFTFADGQTRYTQMLETWMVPGEQEWTLIGLAEGSIGSKTIADQMERSGNFDSDLGENGRVAFYAKGRVLGSVVLTAAYDSAKQREPREVLYPCREPGLLCAAWRFRDRLRPDHACPLQPDRDRREGRSAGWARPCTGLCRANFLTPSPRRDPGRRADRPVPAFEPGNHRQQRDRGDRGARPLPVGADRQPADA